MTIMIEKIARALLASESGGELEWDKLDLTTRGAFNRDARAALTAMLEPSVAMIEAARHAIGAEPDSHADSPEAARAAIVAAIQAALDEQ